MDLRKTLKGPLGLLATMVQAGARGSNNSTGRRHIAARAELRSKLVANLSEVVGVWFPRCVDAEHGGFLCDFDSDWKPAGPQRKRIEFQARQTRAAAQAACFDRRYRAAADAAEHGFRYLTDTMWDRAFGGWFYLLQRNGDPGFTEKHLHGVSYGISACVAYHRLTGSVQALELAQTAFDWMDSHAHDSTHGGHFPYLMRDGTPILVASPGGAPVDPLMHPIGFKDCNTSQDLMTAYVDLFAATKNPQVGERLNELVAISMASMLRPPGILVKTYALDWSTVDDRIEIGLLLQNACTLLDAASLLPAELAAGATDMAQVMVETCLRDMWDGAEAGFYNAAVVTDGTVVVQDDLQGVVGAGGGIACIAQACGRFVRSGRGLFRVRRPSLGIDRPAPGRPCPQGLVPQHLRDPHRKVGGMEGCLPRGARPGRRGRGARRRLIDWDRRNGCRCDGGAARS